MPSKRVPWWKNLDSESIVCIGPCSWTVSTPDGRYGVYAMILPRHVMLALRAKSALRIPFRVKKLDAIRVRRAR